MTLPSAHDVALAAERRSAGRLLLAYPLLTSDGPHADLFPLIRRHADWLTKRFQHVLGYRLLVDTSYARLFKAGLGAGAGHQLERSSGTAFTPRTYACLALALSVLVTAPEQVLLSQLVADIKAAAADAGVEWEDAGRTAQKRTLAAALRQLVDWGVLTETEGSVAAVEQDDSGEALISVDREIARAVVSGPLAQSRSGTDLVRRAADPGFGGARTYVRRMLVETPVVYLDELTDAERDWLRTRQRREAQAFSELLGLETEIRAEGAALVDPEDELSDLHLPGSGTLAQAALLLLERLVEQLRPEDPGHPATGGRLVVGVAIPDGLMEEVLAELVAAYGHRSNWKRDLVDDPPALRASVVDLLIRMRLVARDGSLRSAGRGLPEGYDEAVPEGRAVTDVAGARSGSGSGLMLLAGAARYATHVTVRTAPGSTSEADGQQELPL
ncbi:MULTISPECIES: TIGR02678 family protein [Streptomyces]|uniref:TIGR02678 family protein n=1 Tax=Streptomyces TaxID=1883 RepID=UPI0018DF0660|nr:MULTISPECIES: TIGR02678 family protein [Streptomyces]MCZ4099185.1 TIGR02678 family protein [Streptomyces sp. H39-C1]